MRNHYGDTGNAQDYYYEIGNFDGVKYKIGFNYGH